MRRGCALGVDPSSVFPLVRSLCHERKLDCARVARGGAKLARVATPAHRAGPDRTRTRSKRRLRIGRRPTIAARSLGAQSERPATALLPAAPPIMPTRTQLSLGIMAWNEEDSICHTLESLLRQSVFGRLAARGQQFGTNRLYEADELSELGRAASLEEVSREGVLLKPVPNDQMALLSDAALDGLVAVAKHFPDHCSMNYLVMRHP